MRLNQGYEYREQLGRGARGTTLLDYLARCYPHSSRDAWRVRIVAGEVGRIDTGGEVGHPHIELVLSFPRVDPFSRGDAGVVGIERQHQPVGREPLQQLDVARRPDVLIDGQLVAGEHRHGRNLLALFARQPPVWHGIQPNVGVEADLMAAMTGEHGSPARLGQIADQKT